MARVQKPKVDKSGRTSVGILLWRTRKGRLEVLLGHPGGPYRVLAWALEGDLDAETAVSNSFEMEWPPRSGRIREFPEIDRVEWST